ncbi:unnamed protein product [Prorocentrum cordatum]|uniref:Uncharacterized protein n=1 Tax=Prorocentrum cordatum TaxID=2364126 RepID=A0ABN9SG88_9DINO|nr:unnamed protein product [Polarella glacialis]
MADVLGRRRLWGARPRNPRGPRIFCVHGASLPPSTFPAVRGRTPQDRGGNGCCCGFPSVLNGTAVLHPVPDNARSAAHACARLHLEHVCVPSTLEFEWQGGCGPPLYWSYGGRPRCPVTPVLLLPLLLLSLLLMASKSVTTLPPPPPPPSTPSTSRAFGPLDLGGVLVAKGPLCYLS